MKSICPYFKPDSIGRCQYFNPKKYCTFIHPYFDSINDPIRRKPFFLCIEFLLRNPVLSASVLEAYTICKRKFYFANILGIFPKQQSRPLILGTEAGEILGAMHSSKKRMNANTIYDLIVKKANQKIKECEYDDELQDFMRLYGTLLAYSEIFSDKTGYVPDAGIPERYFQIVRESPKYLIQGFLDILLDETALGGEDVLEFKYTSKHDNYDEFSAFIQVGIYLLSTKRRCVNLRTIQKPWLKMGQNEKPSKFALRVKDDVKRREKIYIKDRHFWLSEFETRQDELFGLMDEIVLEMKSKLLSVKERPEKGIHARLIKAFYQHRKSCLMFGQQCEYKPICTSGVMGDNYIKRESLFKDKKKKAA